MYGRPDEEIDQSGQRKWKEILRPQIYNDCIPTGAAGWYYTKGGSLGPEPSDLEKYPARIKVGVTPP